MRMNALFQRGEEELEILNSLGSLPNIDDNNLESWQRLCTGRLSTWDTYFCRLSTCLGKYLDT